MVRIWVGDLIRPPLYRCPIDAKFQEEHDGTIYFKLECIKEIEIHTDIYAQKIFFGQKCQVKFGICGSTLGWKKWHHRVPLEI